MEAQRVRRELEAMLTQIETLSEQTAHKLKEMVNKLLNERNACKIELG